MPLMGPIQSRVKQMSIFVARQIVEQEAQYQPHADLSVKVDRLSLLTQRRIALQFLKDLANSSEPESELMHLEMVRRYVTDRPKAPSAVREYLRLALRDLGYEVFLVLFLDAQHRVMAHEEMFRGTLTQTSVYPREVVKAALRWNAAAVIFAHNHPSGVAQLSMADELLTRQLKDALALIEVKVLDHFVIAGTAAVSFAERGLI